MGTTNDKENNRKPIYLKIKEELLDKYASLSYYTPLPGEREMCKEFGISRPTLRKAIQLLEDEGKISRLQGKGTFFTGNKIYVDRRLSSTTISFYKDVFSQGKVTNCKILSQKIMLATKEIAEKLNINMGEEVFHLERLRYIDNELYSLSNGYMPMKICPQLLKMDFSNRSLYKTLEENHVFPYKAEQSLEVHSANSYDALYLEIEIGDPISVICTNTLDKDGKIIEYVVTKSPAYKTRFELVVYNKNQEDV